MDFDFATLTAAIIGGLLVWLGQWIERKAKNKDETKKQLTDIYKELRRDEALLKNSFRELAMYKSHAEYWWYCLRITFNKEESEDYVRKHLQSQADARAVERLIGEQKARYISNVWAFHPLKEIPSDLFSTLDNISELKNEKAEGFDPKVPYDVVRFEMADKEEERLREKYFKSLSCFKKINDQLHSSMKN